MRGRATQRGVFTFPRNGTTEKTQVEHYSSELYSTMPRSLVPNVYQIEHCLTDVFLHSGDGIYIGIVEM